MASFPSADGKCVYGKRWTPDGDVLTMRFVPEAIEVVCPSEYDAIVAEIRSLHEAT